MVARPAAPGSMTRAAPPPPQTHFGVRPPPPGGRGFNWERATLDPYGSRAREWGGGWGFGRRGGTEVIVEDVYDDDNADMGCESTGTLAVSRGTSMTDLSEKADSEPRLGHEAKVNFGDDYGYQTRRHHHPRESGQGGLGGYQGYGGLSGGGAPPSPAPPGSMGYGGPPAPPMTSYGRPPPPQLLNTWQRWQQVHPGSPYSDYQNWWNQYGQGGAQINGERGDARMGWMMPTLPGAISESPLRGVFAPDAGLGQGIGMTFGSLG